MSAAIKFVKNFEHQGQIVTITQGHKPKIGKPIVPGTTATIVFSSENGSFHYVKIDGQVRSTGQAIIIPIPQWKVKL